MDLALKTLTQPTFSKHSDDVAYWLAQSLHDFKPKFPMQLPSGNSIFMNRIIASQDVALLQAYARKANMTLSSLFLGVFQCLLHKLDLGDEFAIAMPIANRFTEKEINLVSNLTKSLPITSKFQVNQLLSAYLKQQHACVLDAMEHHDVDFSLLQSEHGIDISGCFDIIYSYMDFRPQVSQLPEQVVDIKFVSQSTNKAPLVLSIVYLATGELDCRFESNERYFSVSMISSMADCYAYLLQTLEQNLEHSLGTLRYIPNFQAQLIDTHSQFVPYDYSQSLAETLLIVCQQNINNIAVKDGDLELTYGHLLQYASNITHAILDQSLATGIGVAILMHKSWKTVAAILGVLWSGNYYIPLDKRNPPKRHSYIISDADIKLMLMDIDPDIAAANTKNDCVKNTLYIDIILEQNAPLLTSVHKAGNDKAYMIYTSGTTGNPKGVTIYQKNVLSLLDSCRDWLDYKPSDRWTLFHACSFDFSVWELFGALCHGATLIIVDDATVANIESVHALLKQERPTMLSLTPTALKNILHEREFFPCKPRYLFFGGEALTTDILSLWRQKGYAETKLINMYGITEITVHATWGEVNLTASKISIGRPLRDTGIKILGQHRQLLPCGFIGELVVSGEGLSSGYWKLDELTKQKFIVLNNNRHYFSGDLASLELDGLFYYHGRRDKQFKLNGYRLEKEDIVAAICNVQPITQVELSIITSESGVQLLCAYYLSDSPITIESIRAEVSQTLPSYALPAHFIHLAAFPLTVNGKIDVDALPAPTDITTAETDGSQDLSVQLLKAWESVLQRTITSEMRQKTFFDLGGNSMTAMLLSRKIAQLSEFVAFSIIDLFKYPTIEQQEKILLERISQHTVG